MKTNRIEVPAEQVTDNPFKLIGADWMLITAGGPGHWNTMTASWGGLGVLWDHNVCFCFVRPTRHTWSFMERTVRFTLSFFDEEYRDALAFCGAHSGRDVDKAAETGLTPEALESGAMTFAEARLVIEARKIYAHDIDPTRFIDPAVTRFYPAKDYHRMYIGAVEKCLIRG